MDTKKSQSLKLLKDNINVMICPVCQRAVEIKPEIGIVCPLKHSYDFSKKGYLNLLKHTPKENYEKDLFEARSQVIEAGLYDSLLQVIVEILNNSFERNQKKIMLDAGCGEGSHLNNLSEELTKNNWTLFGLDIAKEGIALGTKKRKAVTWLVGDLSDLPFKDGSLDVILNILSPGHYESFKRVLKPGGLVIKVIPTASYLKEIREALYPDKPYSHKSVEGHFEKNFRVVDRKTLTYNFQVSNELKPKLLAMTPLTWQHDMEDLIKLNIENVTASFVVLIGKS
jgi:23S rRNA (guanine745-N1)-methyltransferase